jgi:thiol-disulfide isomerase/thioredoxin
MRIASRVQVGILSLVIGVVLVAAGCSPGGDGSAPSSESTDPVAVDTSRAPDFTLPDLDGNAVRFDQIDAEVRVVDFWATWCAPCKEEIPMFKELHATYPPDQVRIIAVSMDDGGAPVVKPFVEEYGIDYLNLIGDDDVYDAFGVQSLPTKYVIDREGNIVKEYYGVVPKKVLIKQIETVLAKGA